MNQTGQEQSESEFYHLHEISKPNNDNGSVRGVFKKNHII